MLCSRLAIISFGERRYQDCRVMVAIDIPKCSSCIRKSSIVSLRHPSVNMRQMTLRVCRGR